MHVLLALRRQREKDQQIEASLNYIVRPYSQNAKGQNHSLMEALVPSIYKVLESIFCTEGTEIKSQELKLVYKFQHVKSNAFHCLLCDLLRA